VISIVTFAFRIELAGLNTVMESVRVCPWGVVEGAERNTVGAEEVVVTTPCGRYASSWLLAETKICPCYKNQNCCYRGGWVQVSSLN
jgi:hypothetical protein